MNRRGFLSMSALALSTTSPLALAKGAKFEAFSPELYQKLLASGEPFMLDFSATW